MSERDASAVPGRATFGDDVGTLESARLDLRQAGYCVMCNAIVERTPDGACASGHPAEAVSCRIMLDADEPLPRLPRFNLGAFLLPFIWGPAHGQWVGAFFLPIWLFMDSVVRSAIAGGWPLRVGALVVVGVTVAFEAVFARRGNGMGYRRVCDRLSVEEFARRERVWAIVSVPAFALLWTWAIWYDVAVFSAR